MAEDNFFTLIDDVKYSKNLKTLLYCPKSKKGTLVIPEGTVRIEDHAFQRCSNLSEIILPKTLQYIGSEAFECCRCNFSEFPDGLLSIGERAFECCSEFTVVFIPKSIKHIGHSAFSRCRDLQLVSLPEGLEEIPDSIFYDCYHLQEVELPSSIKRIGSNAFSRCNRMEFFSMPPFVEEIGSHAFANSNIIIRGSLESLKRVGSYAFSSCRFENDVTFGESLEKIGSYAFEKCTAFRAVTFNGNSEKICKGAFQMCPDLESVVLLKKLKKIEQFAFRRCERLSRFPFGDVEEIDSRAFYGCKAITELRFTKSLKKLGSSVFSFCSGIKTADLSETMLTNIPRSCFSKCTSLETVLLPSRVKKIKDRAFMECSRLININFPIRLRAIGEDAFASCTNLKKIEFKRNLKYIGKKAFSDCYDLENVILNDGLVVIRSYAFENCASIKEINIPKTVSESGKNIFIGCDCLKMLTAYGCRFDMSKVDCREDFLFMIRCITSGRYKYNLHDDNCILTFDTHNSYWGLDINENEFYLLCQIYIQDFFQEDKVIEKYFYKYFTYLMCIGEYETIKGLVETGRFITKENISNLIDTAIEYTQYGGSMEFQVYLMNYKHKHFGDEFDFDSYLLI